MFLKKKISFTPLKIFLSKLRVKLKPLRYVEASLVGAGLFSKTIGKIGFGISMFDLVLDLVSEHDIITIVKDLERLQNWFFDDEILLLLQKHQKYNFGDNWFSSVIEIENKIAEFYWNYDKEDDDLQVYSKNIKILEILVRETLFKDSQGLSFSADHEYNLKLRRIKNETASLPENIRDISDRLDKFDNKISLLLHGEPGTGKSTAARLLASRNNRKYISISTFKLEIGDIVTIIDCLKPDAVIFDDFDRFPKLHEYLSGLEEIRKRCPLIIATVNKYKKIDPALIRPERFDDHFEITGVDEVFIKQLLGDNLLLISDDIYNEIKTWPVVYIKSLNTRITQLGCEVIREEFEKLKSRLIVQRKEYSSDDDILKEDEEDED